MARALQCPTCGAAQHIRNPGIATVACESCSTTLFVKDDVLRAGERSIVAEPPGPIQVGAEGRVGELAVTIVGRVHMAHAKGSWEEWYAETRDGQSLWLVEDGKSYTLEDEIDDVAGLHAGLALGDVVQVSGVSYQVHEIGEGQVRGVEGQVPRDVQPGQLFSLIDLTEVGGTATLTAEIDLQTSSVSAYLGHSVAPSDLQFSGQPDEAGVHGEAIAAEHIACASCGAPFDLPTQGAPAITAGCPHCGAVLDLSQGVPSVLSRNPTPPSLPFAIGASGTLLDTEWEVVGRMAYLYDGRWPGSEYLLWQAEQGYLWLSESDGNYVASRAVAEGPLLSEVESTPRNASLRTGGRAYAMFEQGVAELVYVDGALPWLAKVGDRHQYWDLIAPPFMLGVEVTDRRELEYFVGEYVPHTEVYEALAPDTAPPNPSEPSPLEPNPIDRAWAGAGAIFFVFFAINLLLCLGTLNTGQRIATFKLPSSVTTMQSEPFVVPDVRVLGLHIDTGANNSWVYVDLELVEADSLQSYGGFGKDIEYYHGTEGGESWTEGSNNSESYVAAPPPGVYKLIIQVEAEHPTAVHVKVSAGDQLSRYPLILALLMLIGPVLIILRYYGFEKRRWSDD